MGEAKPLVWATKAGVAFIVALGLITGVGVALGTTYWRGCGSGAQPIKTKRGIQNQTRIPFRKRVKEKVQPRTRNIRQDKRQQRGTLGGVAG